MPASKTATCVVLAEITAQLPGEAAPRPRVWPCRVQSPSVLQTLHFDTQIGITQGTQIAPWQAQSSIQWYREITNNASQQLKELAMAALAEANHLVRVEHPPLTDSEVAAKEAHRQLKSQA